MFSRYEFKQDVEFDKNYNSNIKILGITNFSFYTKNETEFLADVVQISMLFEAENKYRINHETALQYCSDKYILAKVELTDSYGRVRVINKYPIDVKMLSANAIIRFCALSESYKIFDYLDDSQRLSKENSTEAADKFISSLKKDLKINFANGAKTKLMVKNIEK